MLNYKIEDIAKIVNGTIKNCSDKSAIVTNVQSDSRVCTKNSCFIAIKGEKVDGADFIDKTKDLGAICAITNQDRDFAIPTIVVDDVIDALQALATDFRLQFDIPFYGITGSCGKTTTKEMLACCLQKFMPLLKTPANENGQLGTPLTLLTLDKSAKCAVMEMGLSARGEMEKVASMVRPKQLIMTNIGASHEGQFSDKNEILQEKLLACTYFDKNSKLFLNHDDSFLSKIKKDCNIIYYGKDENLDYFCSDIKENSDNISFIFHAKNQKYNVTIPILGAHNALNATAVLAFISENGFDINVAIDALANFSNESSRLQVIEKNKITVIDDCYNANPDSMASALKTINNVYQNRRKIAILADMLEIGVFSDEEHKNIGKLVAELDYSVLITFGKNSENIHNKALEANKNSLLCYHFDTKEDALLCVQKQKKDGDVILIKASHAMNCEFIVKSLTS